MNERNAMLTSIISLLPLAFFLVLIIAEQNDLCAAESSNAPYFAEEVLFPQSGRFFYRIPTMQVTKTGTVLAAVNARWNSSDDFSHTTLVARRRSSEGAWEPIITIGGDEKHSCGIGSSVYDPQSNRLIIFGGGGCYVSTDDARTFSFEKLRMTPNKSTGKVGGTHGSGPGIVLQHGKHIGRLLVPARFAYGRETAELQRKPKEFKEFLQTKNYNCAIYSDDSGATWTTSDPVQLGTGEGTLAELQDGKIYYNSRAYFLDGKRRTAISHDGGSTYGDFTLTADLVEPPFGCNASLLRVQTKSGDDFLLYSGPQNAKKRSDLSLLISRDNGAHWKKLYNFTPGSFGAYSALRWSEKDQKIYLLYETNKYNPQIEYGEFVIAEFNPEWLARLEKTKPVAR